MGPRLEAGFEVGLGARGDVAVLDDRAVFLTDGAGSPDGVAAVIVADEVALRVDGGAAGAVFADVSAVLLRVAGLGLGSDSEKSDRCDGERGDDGFHGQFGFSITLISTKCLPEYSWGNSRFP